MATSKKTTTYTKPENHKIFISWSKPYSKKFARKLKEVLERRFAEYGLACFVSDQDIASGTDWWDRIKNELHECKMGIICITKENRYEPWLYFESGAIIANTVPCTPLLLSCNNTILQGTPLSAKQAVDFYNFPQFLNMLKDITKRFDIRISPENLEVIGKDAHNELTKFIESDLSDMKDFRYFNKKYVYPSEIASIKKNTIYISAPMSSLQEGDYSELRNCIIELKQRLVQAGFNEKGVISPYLDILNPTEFDGEAKAIKNNFPAMKQSECMIVIAPWNLPSSILVEIGYGIALTKKMVIFYKEDLPYMVRDAGNSIDNVKVYRFSSYEDILNRVKRSGMALFNDDNIDE